MKNPLDKELGFSINKSLHNKSNSLFKDRDFAKLVSDFKRGKKIEDILNKEIEDGKKKNDIDNNIKKWIENKVNKEFLKIVVAGIRLRARWEYLLKESLKLIVKSNNDIFDLETINSSILDHPQYCNFKSFIHQGKTMKSQKNISYVFSKLEY